MDFLDDLQQSWTMRHLRFTVTVIATAALLASCDSTATAPTSGTDARTSVSHADTSVSVASQTSQTPTIDSIPTIVNTLADQGCLDEAGTLHAHATDWYPGSTGSPLGLSGEHTTSTLLDDFVSAANGALAEVAPGFVLTDAWENRRTVNGCVTHRYADYTNGDDRIVVSAWRVVSAADSFWVPNEAAFTAIDDDTLVSRGDHIAIVLAVAPDGTTSRVSVYGARALDRVSGWPSTFAPDPSVEPPGLTPLTADALVPLTHELLTHVLGGRSG